MTPSTNEKIEMSDDISPAVKKNMFSLSSTVERHPNVSQPTVVSHVPVSIGSHTHPSSTNSSISTKGEDDVDKSQEAIIGLEEAHATSMTRDSRSESCRECSGIVNASPCEMKEMFCGGRKGENAYSSEATIASYPLINTAPKRLARNVTPEQLPAIKRQRLDTFETVRPIAPAPSSTVLLARDQDESVLNPLHVFVRKQIEVFTASPIELQQPSPGRKHPIHLHQVGLRCIHCRHRPNRERVKRAVCYPSSVGRVYHSVSDMKFDHFSNCKDLPNCVRSKFEGLKAEGKRNTEKKNGQKGHASSTAQYYHEAALKMGMVNGSGGIFMSSAQMNMTPSHDYSQLIVSVARRQLDIDLTMDMIRLSRMAGLRQHRQELDVSMIRSGMLSSSLLMNALTAKNNARHTRYLETSLAKQPSLHSTLLKVPSSSDGQQPVDLADEQDRKHLNGLHCFVRKHVEVFIADEMDAAAPAPGRKTKVVLGQVGLRCVHCVKLPLKKRVKRAVCYPPSVGGIYHSVSNMKFDHFAICRGLPDEARSEFQVLKNSCGRRGTAGNSNFQSSTGSTSQYYNDSALRKGLVDTESGIRFKDATKKKLLVASTAAERACGGFSALVRAASQAQSV